MLIDVTKYSTDDIFKVPLMKFSRQELKIYFETDDPCYSSQDVRSWP